MFKYVQFKDSITSDIAVLNLLPHIALWPALQVMFQLRDKQYKNTTWSQINSLENSVTIPGRAHVKADL